VRSIARALTARRRSSSAPLSRFGSLRATSRRVCVIASGVRSSWEALAANLCCSATCASSCASMVSKASESSRNSSLRPGNRIRWESDPLAAVRVASVMRVRGASMRPARIHPPARPNTSRNTRTATPAWPKACWAGERPGKNAPPMPDLVALMIGAWGKYRMRTIHRASSKAPASTRKPA